MWERSKELSPELDKHSSPVSGESDANRQGPHRFLAPRHTVLVPFHSLGLGDLWETTNLETAAGVTSRFHSDPWHPRPWLEIATEPGIYLRAGQTDQTKSLINPANPTNPSRVALCRRGIVASTRVSAHSTSPPTWTSICAFGKRLRVSGGVRADLLGVSIDDHLQDVVLVRVQFFAAAQPEPSS